MPSNTLNHAFYQPDSGQDNVANELNQNLAALDALLKHISGDGETYAPSALSVGNSTISDLTGANLSVDPNGALTATDTQLNDEQVQDIVGAFVSGSGASTVTYDDVAGTLTVDSTDTDTQLSGTDVRAYIDGETITPLGVEWKTQNGAILNGNHTDFATAQNAIDFATANTINVIRFRPGTYGPLTLSTGQIIRGAAVAPANNANPVLFQSNTAGTPAITMNTNCALENVRVETTAGTTNAVVLNNNNRVTDSGIAGSTNHGFYQNNNATVVRGCRAAGANVVGNQALIDTNGARNVFIGNAGLTITNNGGASNVLVGNA